MSLPDLQRPRLTLPSSRLSTVAWMVAAATWRALHPSVRERYLEAPRPRPLPRVYYEAQDGWRSPLRFLEARPGASAEPVVLAHTFGTASDAFRYGQGTLAATLHRAGFSVYLLSHRGDRDALPPGASRRTTPRDVLDFDLPAALAAVAEHAGAHRVHLVGHGLGGLLALSHASNGPRALASVVALGAPLSLPTVRTEARAVQLALRLVPSHWPVPMRALARLGVPLVEGDNTPGPRVRGVLTYAIEDIPAGFLRQFIGWARRGSPMLAPDRELQEAIVAARVPVLSIRGGEDPLCAHDEALWSRWGHPDRSHLEVPGYGHLDLLLASDAQERVFTPVVDWLSRRRKRAWFGVDASMP